MTHRTLLIATTNKGKLAEIQAIFAQLPFTLLTLEDLATPIALPEEYGRTIEENAMIKARYYGEASGHLTLADDGGMFIEALGGWPGVISDRIAPTREEKIQLVLSKLQGNENRNAAFRVCNALYDPIDGSVHCTTGRMPFVVAEEPATEALQTDWGYTTIMYLPEAQKVYAQLTIKETQSYSHRYQALRSMSYYLESTYGHKNIVVGFALVIQNGKLLMQQRNDPGNTGFHGKWEFPGGGIDFGETMHSNVIRETKEECGLDVEVVNLLQYIHIESMHGKKRPYQVILLPHLCRVVGGVPAPCDTEVMDLAWFDLDDVLSQDLVSGNKKMMERLLPELKEFLEINPL
jgi:XTP/dITP diphosphohydrolase